MNEERDWIIVRLVILGASFVAFVIGLLIAGFPQTDKDHTIGLIIAAIAALVFLKA